MNVVSLLTQKNQVRHINLGDTFRQALEAMEIHRYTSVPVLSESGKYVGTLTEGDLLWALRKEEKIDGRLIENLWIEDIAMKIHNKPATIMTKTDEITEMLVKQNFIPVVDDEKVFIGILKRGDVIAYLMKKYGHIPYKANIFTPKNDTPRINQNIKVKDAIEMMSKYKYNAIPVVDDDGKYVETLTEGDLLWSMKTKKGIEWEMVENLYVKDIASKIKEMTLLETANFSEIVKVLGRQNIVCMTDENGLYKGYVKRGVIMEHFIDIRKEEKLLNEKKINA